METISWEEQTNILSNLKEKHNEIKSQVMVLTQRVAQNNWKKKVVNKITSEVSSFTSKLALITQKLHVSDFSKREIQSLSDSLVHNVDTVFKGFSVDLESMVIDKLSEVYQMQSSITLKTEEIYKEKISALHLQLKNLKACKSKSFDQDRFSVSQEQNHEMHQNMTRIVQENSQFMNAVKQNLMKVAGILKPNIERTLALFNSIRPKVPNMFMRDFSDSRSEIESEYRLVIEYINSFFSLLDEFSESTVNFDKFSEISKNEYSLHRLETEDIDLRDTSQNCRSPCMKRESPHTSGIDGRVLFRMIEEELSFDKETTRQLREVIETLKKERRSIDEISRTSTDQCRCIKKITESKINLIGKTVGELLDILGHAISTRESKIRTLEGASPAEIYIEDYSCISEESYGSNKDEIQQPIPKKTESYHSSQDITFMRFMENRDFSKDKEGKGRMGKDKNVSYKMNARVNGGESNSESSEEINLVQPELKFDAFCTDSSKDLEINRLKTEIHMISGRNAANEGKIKELITENSQIKKEINELLLENDRVMLSSSKLKSAKLSLRFLFQEFGEFKKSYQEEVTTFQSEIQGKISAVPRIIFNLRRAFEKNYEESIEELSEQNENLKIQNDALKDAFQVEVKKINLESQEIKKMNKDLKDSLLKLSNKFDTQNKSIGEIAQLLPNLTGDNLSGIKNFITLQIAFNSEVFALFQEKDLPKILETLSELKKESNTAKEPRNSILLKFNEPISDLELYTGQTFLSILSYLQQRDRQQKILISEVKQVFEKNTRNVIATFSALIDEKLIKIQGCVKNLGKLKRSLLSQKGVFSSESINNETLLEEMTNHICDLEEQIQEHKFNQIELNNIITKQAKDFIQLTEESNKAKIFTTKCMRVLQHLSDLQIENSQFVEIKSEIVSILSSNFHI